MFCNYTTHYNIIFYVFGANMIDISIHKIVGIAIDTPGIDDNWVQFTIKNTKGEEFEITTFVQQYGDDKVTVYEFLHDLRDSTERAIKELISVQQSQSED